jgi:hypothetical protein
MDDVDKIPAMIAFADSIDLAPAVAWISANIV